MLISDAPSLSSDATARAGPYNIHTNVIQSPHPFLRSKAASLCLQLADPFVFLIPKSPGLDSDLVPLLLFIVVTSGWSQSAMTRGCLVCITG